MFSTRCVTLRIALRYHCNPRATHFPHNNLIKSLPNSPGVLYGYPVVQALI